MSWFTVACNRFTIWVRGICDGLKGLPEVVGKPLSTVADLIHSQWWCPGLPDCHLRRGGQNLCRRVTFEVQMQTRSTVAGQNRASASGSSDTRAVIAEIRS